MDKNNCRSLLNIPKNKFVIVCVGNLVELKGHKYLFDAIKKLSNKNIICYIIGEGNNRGSLERYVTSLHLSDQIIFCGWKDHRDIPLWLNASDLFVLPSLNEGNPTVMFESLAVGLPFIGTRVGGIPEIITSSDYGYVVNLRDSDDLVEKIELSLYKKWDKDLIINYSTNFTWEKISKKILNIYQIYM
jgi:glycosyltransferase involved in cell wall biosynthesis